MSDAHTAVVVFTRDLRIRDNPALSAACRAEHVVPLFVVDDTLVRRTHRNANRLRFLLDSLTDLDASLQRLGGALVVRRGDWGAEIASVVDRYRAGALHLADDGSTYASRRLDALRAALAYRDCSVTTHPGVTVVPAGDLRTGTGSTYQMFTPFYRRWSATPWRRITPSPRAVPLPTEIEPTGAVPALADLTDAEPSPRLAAGGEHVGLARLRTWAAGALATYADTHDAVAADATSRISPHLHFGCLSPLEVATRLRDRPGAAPFVRQLCWRDFFHQLLTARPELARDDMRDRGTPLGTTDEAFAAWCAGRTGYPLVDAGMRQLQAEGFVHNRVRMVVASFLTKDLDVAWQHGARHFMTWLVDGDVASNQLNWQWVAGTGTDANPHRVFNPTRQAERFDPDGRYIRRYVPELAAAGDATIHDPPAEERARFGYPERLVEHAEAIAAYRSRIRP